MDLLSLHGYGGGKYDVGDNIELVSIGLVPTAKLFSSQCATIEIDINGNVYFAGYRNGINKFDKNGNKLWTYAYSTTQAMQNIKFSKDNAIYCVGDNKDLIKLDLNGNLIWQKTNIYTGMQKIVVDKNNAVYGKSTDATTYDPTHLIKVDANQNLVFNITYDFYITDILCDGDFIYVLGQDKSNSNINKIYKLDLSGNIVYTCSLPTTDNCLCFAKFNNSIYVGSVSALWKVDFSTGNLISKYTTSRINSVDVDFKENVVIALYQGNNNIIKLNNNLQVIYTLTHTNSSSSYAGHGAGIVKLDSLNGCIYSGYYADNMYQFKTAYKILS